MRIKTKDKVRKSVLLEPAIWAQIEDIQYDEDEYINTIIGLLIKAGLEIYSDYGYGALTGDIRNRQITNTAVPASDAYLYDD